MATRIRKADRLLLIPDDVLHLLPFAGLTDPIDGESWLVERRPFTVAISATVFAELKKERRPHGEARVVAFGDPDYPPP